MRYRLILKSPLVWESDNPEKPNQTLITFIQAKLPKKDVFEFNEIEPSSNPGDCAESLYPQLEGRSFRLSPDGDLVEEQPFNMYPIHCSQEKYEKEFGYPKGTKITNVPYNGKPFSNYTIIEKGNKSISVQFGTGGYYPDIAFEHIETTLK